MHEQLAEARLVERLGENAAHRAAILDERLDGGAALRRDKVADGLAGEVGLAREPREVIRDARTTAGGADGDDGEQLVTRPGDEELELAVLVDRPDGAYRGRALAVLAETLGPELDVPARKALEPVRAPRVRNGVPLIPRRPKGSVRPTMALVNRLRDEA